MKSVSSSVLGNGPGDKWIGFSDGKEPCPLLCARDDDRDKLVFERAC